MLKVKVIIVTKLNEILYYEYTLDYIENIMSLRTPQIESLRILDGILRTNKLSKNINVENYQRVIKRNYHIFKEFERPFQSITFELATGVGKTRLMGAMITYLYTNKGVKNFFIVAPSLTIYDKLKNDLGNPSVDNDKYVFKGIGCFSINKPSIWTDDDYRERQVFNQSIIEESVNIYIYNISKFNTEDRKMHSINEYLGESFYDYLRSLDDLVVIMDESHHYRAEASFKAINKLNPVLGIELSATAKNPDGSLFKNVVYEYTLYDAILDGYVRTPYVLTRTDLKTNEIDETEMDKIMLFDGLLHHRNIMLKLEEYSSLNDEKLIKPFVLVVCKNTVHADKIYNHITSNLFYDSYYKDKTITIHSNQRGSEKEENINLLLDVEKTSNPIEIVIHVNILKEGWDVNNLYTIIPLRTASSKILREQTVGRGLRLPFGKLTGNQLIDSVTLTAHDKFEEIINEAKKGDSIFNPKGVIYANYQNEIIKTPIRFPVFKDDNKRNHILRESGLDYKDPSYKEYFSEIQNKIIREVNNNFIENNTVSNNIKDEIIKESNMKYKDNSDMKKLINEMYRKGYVDQIINETRDRTIFIPKIITKSIGEESYKINDFNLDLSNMVYVPLAKEILIKSLLSSGEADIIIVDNYINLDSFDSEKKLITEIRKISEVNYEESSHLVVKLVRQFLSFYRERYSEDEVKNIVWGYLKRIVKEIKNQLLVNIEVVYEKLVEVVEGINPIIIPKTILNETGIRNLSEDPGKDSIKTLIYDGGNKSTYSPYRFDSNSERIFANVCESSNEVIQWLRPQKKQFNITYNNGQQYIPDFVVETNDMYYLVEVKGNHMINDPDVIAKKERAIQYCKIASEYNRNIDKKEFRYLFIPHDEIQLNSSFNNLKDRFIKN